MIGYWPLNESSGEALDHSGNENHGSLNGATQGTPGVLGENSYSFSSRGDVVTVSDTAVLNPERITLSAWAKFDELYDDSASNTQSSIFRKFEAYVLYADRTSNGMQFYNWESGTRLSTGVVPNTGEWEFWTATNNGSEIKIYRNGKLIGSTNDTVQASSTNALGIGASGETQEYGMLGNIQEARIYNRPLTQSEIQYLYSVGKRGLQTTGKKSS